MKIDQILERCPVLCGSCPPLLCSGVPDDAACPTTHVPSDCDDMVIADAVRKMCPALCGACTTTTTPTATSTTTATTTTTTGVCNGVGDPIVCARRYTVEDCADKAKGGDLRLGCPVLCGTCGAGAATPTPTKPGGAPATTATATWEPAGTDCNCGARVQQHDAGFGTPGLCGGACGAEAACASFGLWTAADKGKCVLFDARCGPTCTTPTATDKGKRNQVYNLGTGGAAAAADDGNSDGNEAFAQGQGMREAAEEPYGWKKYKDAGGTDYETALRARKMELETNWDDEDPEIKKEYKALDTAFDKMNEDKLTIDAASEGGGKDDAAGSMIGGIAVGCAAVLVLIVGAVAWRRWRARQGDADFDIPRVSLRLLSRHHWCRAEGMSVTAAAFGSRHGAAGGWGRTIHGDASDKVRGGAGVRHPMLHDLGSGHVRPAERCSPTNAAVCADVQQPSVHERRRQRRGRQRRARRRGR